MDFKQLIKTTLFGLILFIPILSNSQDSSLKMDEIMKGNEFIGHQPFDFKWGPNSENIYFRWNKDNELVAPHYVYSLAEKRYEKLKFQSIPAPITKTFTGPDAIYFKSGISIYKTSTNGKTEPVYTSTIAYNIHSIVNDNLLLEIQNNLYAINLTSGLQKQLTHFTEGNNPQATEESTTFLENEQPVLFETTRKKLEKEEAERAYKKLTTPQFLTPYYLEDWSMKELAINTQLTALAFIKSKYPKNQPTEFMQYITADGYSTSKKARSKVGEENPKHELLIWDLKNDSVRTIDFSKLTDLNKPPTYYSEYPNINKETYKKELIFHLHNYNTTGDKCLVEIKSYDNKDRWIGYIDMPSNEFIEIDHQHDEAWIGGPGITGWNMVKGNLGWINATSFYYQSEKTGYSHLYIANSDTKSTEALTQGKFEVHAATLSTDKTKFYISANKNHPGNREFYSLDIKSKSLSPILTADGNHEVHLSPNEKWLLVNYSYKNKPWDLYIGKNKENANITQITNSASESFKQYSWREPSIITYKASDGEEIHARLYEPTTDKKNGAAIFFVHGAGYLQNAHNWWSGYYREYMFNNMLCDKGYTVMDIDFRASKGYGRDFRTAIYRDMGGKDLNDYVDARAMLVKDYGIDPDRVGIYGGSYGGFITIMALLKEPKKFKCGAAIRSVTDWSHYNHPYTSNILNTPDEDPKAFQKSSPIYYAENLENRLLMLHGMVDDNVQYQDVVRLSQRFIELGKKNWDLVGYPVEPHGFKETTSWIDEYGRILQMFDEELLPKE